MEQTHSPINFYVKWPLMAILTFEWMTDLDHLNEIHMYVKLLKSVQNDKVMDYTPTINAILFKINFEGYVWSWPTVRVHIVLMRYTFIPFYFKISWQSSGPDIYSISSMMNLYTYRRNNNEIEIKLYKCLVN